MTKEDERSIRRRRVRREVSNSAEPERSLPPEVYPYRTRFLILGEGPDDGRVTPNAREWWLGRYGNMLPESLASTLAGVGHIAIHLQDFINTTQEISPEVREAVVAFPDFYVGSELARKFALSSKELGLVLLYSLASYDLQLDRARDLNLPVPTEENMFNGWMPRRIIEDQKRLGLSAGVIEESMKLAKDWKSHQILPQLDFGAPLDKPMPILK